VTATAAASAASVTPLFNFELAKDGKPGSISLIIYNFAAFRTSIYAAQPNGWLTGAPLVGSY
jgi:hypothetical protein